MNHLDFQKITRTSILGVLEMKYNIKLDILSYKDLH